MRYADNAGRPFLSLSCELSPNAIRKCVEFWQPPAIVYRSSVELLLSDLNDLEIAVAEANEEAVSEGIPGNGGDLVELVVLHLLGLLLLEVLLALQLKVTLTNNGGVLGFEVPDLPSDLSTDSDPVTAGIKSKAVNGGSSIVTGSGLLNVAEVEDADLLVLSTGDDEVASGGNSDGIDAAVVDLDAVLDVEGLVVPDLKVAVPADGGEVLSASGLGGGGDESDLGDPVAVVVLLDCVLAVTLDVPELDLAISAGGEDISTVAGDSAREDLFGMAVLNETLSGLSGSQVPKTQRAIPGGRKEVVVVVGEGEVADEVGVASELLDGLSEVRGALGLVVELPDEDGSVTGGSDQYLGVLILFLGVSSLNGSDPVRVALKVTDFLGMDGAFLSHHKQTININ